MSGFSLRNVFSPIPLTFISSSIFLKLPFFWRYSRMRVAAAGPIFGSVRRSAADAVFRLTGLAGVARTVAVLVGRLFVATGEDAWRPCASTLTAEQTKASVTVV